MKFNRLNTSIFLGLFAIFGILILQIFWTKEAFSIEEKKFSQKVQISLLEVVKSLYEGTNSELPLQNPIKKMTNDYYIVNIDNDFEAEILEYNLIKEFKKNNVFTNFEYAIYNCQSDEMVYGNYVNLENKNQTKKAIYFPKQNNLVYYFAIRFPNETSFLFQNLAFWIISTFLLLLILVIYVYSIFTLLQQKKYAELQRDFINNMTHEFKTPLSSILIASNLLKNNQEIKNNEKLEKYTHIISNQSVLLNQHVERILNIAKADNDSLILQKTNFEISVLLQKIIDEVKEKNENCTIKFSFEKQLNINADCFHFKNIVFNIIENAIKYSDNFPEIVISIKTENNQIKISFADHGIGINEQDKNLIFEKFTRLQPENNTKVSGFGLGLFYVKKVCQQHNWKIYVAKNLPKGTIFTIEIPN